MKLKPVYNSRITKILNVGAITLYPFVFFSQSKDESLKTRTIHHEAIHVRQVRSLGWFKFYFLYIKEYFSSGYLGISYEKEAYANQKTVVLTDEELKEFGV